MNTPTLRACASPENKKKLSARNALINKAMWVPVKLAKKFKSRFPDQASDLQDELVCEGFVELIEAANRFDPGAKVKFSTYAWQCIETKFRNQIKARSTEKRVPDLTRRAKSVATDQSDEQREMSSQTLNERPRSERTLVPVSFGSSVLDGNLNILDLDGFQQNGACSGHRLVAIAQFLKRLQRDNPVQAEIAELTLQGELPEEISRRVNVSRSRVSQISKQLLQSA
jgi:RNA polymerase sigma factor (sigma-70 family)